MEIKINEKETRGEKNQHRYNYENKENLFYLNCSSTFSYNTEFDIGIIIVEIKHKANNEIYYFEVDFY